MRYGFVGLGNLGVHLASSLARGGFPVTVYDLNADSTVPAIAAGATRSESLEALAAACDALIAVIGRNWVAAEKDKRRRIDDPDDFVRIEIEAALSVENGRDDGKDALIA